jgi:uncharacterized protein (DUF302 family)
MDEIAFEVSMEEPVEEALERLYGALKKEGFGVLTRIDVRATMKEKLNEDFRPYYILGACNPPLAYRALTSDPRIGLMLPCNITLEEELNGGSLVRIANPEMMLHFGEWKDNTALNEVARHAQARLERVALDLKTGLKDGSRAA